jgi:hypothetical protein
MDEYAAATNDSTMEAPHDTTREKDFDWADVDFESGSDDGEEHVTGQHENYGDMGGEPSEEPHFTKDSSSQATSATEEKVANETLHPDTFPKGALYQAGVEPLQEQQPSAPPEEEQQEERRKRKPRGLEMSGGSPSSCVVSSATTVGKEASLPVFVFQQESRSKATLDFQQEDHQVVQSMQQAHIEHEQSPSKEDKTTEKNGPVANESSDLSTEEEATALGLLFPPIS